jgi:hypothetical protein
LAFPFGFLLALEFFFGAKFGCALFNLLLLLLNRSLLSLDALLHALDVLYLLNVGVQYLKLALDRGVFFFFLFNLG